eukprot:m.3752 g.3752  ORF g.3752 m.3752 type:complete len:89 (+) comp6532_c0_seq1:1351-1617(+)
MPRPTSVVDEVTMHAILQTQLVEVALASTAEATATALDVTAMTAVIAAVMNLEAGMDVMRVAMVAVTGGKLQDALTFVIDNFDFEQMK